MIKCVSPTSGGLYLRGELFRLGIQSVSDEPLDLPNASDRL